MPPPMPMPSLPPSSTKKERERERGGGGEIRKSIVNEDENGLLSLSSSGAHAKGGSSKWCLMIQNSKVAQVKDQHEENTHQVSFPLKLKRCLMRITFSLPFSSAARPTEKFGLALNCFWKKQNKEAF